MTEALPLSPRARVAATAAALVPALVLLALCHGYTVDDAFILFRYGQLLAGGHGFAFNPGGPPLEGFTNPLYVVLSAALVRLGVDPVMPFKLVGVLAGLLCLALTPLLGRALGLSGRASALAAVALGLASGFWFWAVSGLETALFAATWLGAVLLFVQGRDTAAGLLMLAASLTRTEGPAFAVALVALRAWEGGPRSAWPLVRAFALPYAAYFAARWAHFGHLFPNPVYFKSGEGPSVLGPFFRTWGGWCLAAAAGVALAPRQLRAPALLLATALAVYAGARTVVGGTCITMSFYDRFLLPWVPLLLLCGAHALDRARRPLGTLAAGALLATTAWGSEVNPRITGTLALSTSENVAPAVDALAAETVRVLGPSARVAIADVGRFGYRYPGTLVDLFGLNDYRFTLSLHRDIPAWAAEVLASRPDAFVFVAREGPGGLEVFHDVERAVFDAPDFKAHYARAFQRGAGNNPWFYVLYAQIPPRGH